MAAKTDHQPDLPLTSRQLVVSQLVQPRGRDLVSVPYIRLSGLWLKRAGFPIGARIEVRISQGELLLVRADTNHRS
jgi:hypothetical protein